jgi:hypothetical protein
MLLSHYVRTVLLVPDADFGSPAVSSQVCTPPGDRGQPNTIWPLPTAATPFTGPSGPLEAHRRTVEAAE